MQPFREGTTRPGGSRWSSRNVFTVSHQGSDAVVSVTSATKRRAHPLRRCQRQVAERSASVEKCYTETSKRVVPENLVSVPPFGRRNSIPVRRREISPGVPS